MHFYRVTAILRVNCEREDTTCYSSNKSFFLFSFTKILKDVKFGQEIKLLSVSKLACTWRETEGAMAPYNLQENNDK